jgi:lipoprotein-anchoring transpeptidase ErfK/SrfK
VAPAKWIEINLSIPQKLTAWEGNNAVYSTLVSAGVPAHPTPLGTFQVYWKLPYDDMTGGNAGTDDYYYLPNVPNVMYFYQGGYAIHGAYWHANFGYPVSHDCINLPLDAAWMYNWTPVGTQVWIHY